MRRPPPPSYGSSWRSANSRRPHGIARRPEDFEVSCLRVQHVLYATRSCLRQHARAAERSLSFYRQSLQASEKQPVPDTPPLAAHDLHDGRRGSRVVLRLAALHAHRCGAEPVRATLFGKGGVQGLDGHPHQHRKAMFLSLLTPQRVEHLADEVAAAWSEATGHWQQQTKIVLYEAVQQLLTQAVCRWAGAPMPPVELPLRTADWCRCSMKRDRCGTFVRASRDQRPSSGCPA